MITGKIEQEAPWFWPWMVGVVAVLSQYNTEEGNGLWKSGDEESLGFPGDPDEDVEDEFELPLPFKHQLQKP